MTDPVPDVTLTSVRRSLWDRMSVVWLVPLAALVIALGVAWQTYAERGPLIEIVFDDPAGVAEGQTELRFRNVAVGKVEDVRFTDNLERVIVAVRLDPRVADFVDSSAQFWVVRPEVTTQGVSGLETVLSGVFIEGQWDSTPDGIIYQHEGENTVPLMTASQDGLRIVLRSTDGALTTAMPLLYQGVPVGRVGDAQVSEDGLSVQAEAVVFAPHDRLVRKATRFWDASGFSLSLGSAGATVNFASLASLIVGGATFETFVSGSPPAEDGDVFDIFLYEEDARASVFNRDDAPVLSLTAVFDGNVAGLTNGAAVELEGLRIGEVSGIDGLIDRDRFGDDDVHLVAVLSIQPARLGFEGTDSRTEALDYIAAQVEQGLRARLVTGSLLTGGLKVQLLAVEGAEPASLDRDAQPYPAIPSTESQITDVAATAQGTLTRINDLPIEDLLNSAIGFMDNASMLVGSPDVQSVPEQISGLIADVRGVVGSDEVKAVPEQLAALLAEIEATVTDVRGVLTDIQSRDAVGRLLGSVDAIEAAAAQAGGALDGVPGLIDQITAVAAKAEALELDALVAQAGNLMASADALLGSDQVAALPGDLSAALADLRLVLDDVRSGGIVANANATMASAAEAADQIAVAAAELPGLIDRANALLNSAGTAVAGFSNTSVLVRNAEQAIREVTRAAEAIAALARTIERNPNALIFGR